MGEQTRAPPSGDLDALLDDALNAFDTLDKGNKLSDEQNEHATATTSPIDTTASPSESSPSTSQPPPPAQKKGLAFDPLGAKRRPPQSTAAVEASLQKDLSEALSNEQLDDISTGLSQLLAELAQAGDYTEDAGPATSGICGQQEQLKGLAATMRALAENQPQFKGETDDIGGLPDDFLEKLAAQMAGGGVPRGGLGAGSEEDELPEGMSSLVDMIMQQLLAKDVLYQPMKDIGTRYPSWLEENRSKLSDEEIQRYQEQLEYINRITALYETTPDDYGTLMELLQEMQQRGQPPQEIIDELAPGLSFGPDGLPNVGGGDGEGGGDPLSDCKMQ